MRRPGVGGPRQVLAAALPALEELGMRVRAVSKAIDSEPLGPSRRRYANAVAIVESGLAPDGLLAALQRLEQAFGRRRRGSRWQARPLDLDIVLWSGGCWATPGLSIPHAGFRSRAFVLDPAADIAGSWRDPLTGLTLRHLGARLTRPRPLPRCARWSGP